MLINKKEKKKVKVIIGVLFFAQVIFVLWCGKSNFHVDEFYTYGLSNSENGMNPVFEDGKIYTNLGAYEDYLTVDNSERFDYVNVWKNQTLDVHPPLYYAFIHSICSFFPGVFTKWFGIAFNLVCLFVINILAFCIGKELFKKDYMGFLFATVNGVAFVTMNMILFIRMYALMTVFIMSVILLFICHKDETNLNWKFWVQLYIYSVLGALTQYYFLIFLFFACLFWGIRFIVKHQWKNTVKYLLCLGMAGVTSIAIFPAMLEQIFGSGYRGKEAFANARSVGNFFPRLKEYVKILDETLFGSVLIAVLVVCLIFWLLKSKNKVSEEIKKLGNDTVGLIFVSSIGYICVIAKIAPYIEARYIMSVGWALILLVLWILYVAFSSVFCRDEWKSILYSLVAVFGFMILSSYYKGNWKPFYSYENTKQYLSLADQYKEKSVIYVYDVSWKTMPNMLELMKYKNYTFSREENLAEILADRQDEDLVVYVIGSLDNAKILQQVIDSNEQLVSYEKIYAKDYANVYYVN